MVIHHHDIGLNTWQSKGGPPPPAGTTGLFQCADAETGKTLFAEKLGADQVHASPAYADGRFYVPMHEARFFVIEVKDGFATEAIVSHRGFPARIRFKAFIASAAGP